MKVSVIAFVILLMAGSCLAEEQYGPIRHMNLTPAQMDWVYQYSPLAIEWAESTEAKLLTEGRRLSDAEARLAKAMSVSKPENIRVLVTDEFPTPSNQELYEVFLEYGLHSPNMVGMVLGYVILLKPGHEDSIQLLSHEFVHVSQVESHGLRTFLVTYLAELKVHGYWDSPMEREARNRSVLEPRP